MGKNKKEDDLNAGLVASNHNLINKRGDQGWNSPRSSPPPRDENMPRDIGGLDRPE